MKILRQKEQIDEAVQILGGIKVVDIQMTEE